LIHSEKHNVKIYSVNLQTFVDQLIRFHSFKECI